MFCFSFFFFLFVVCLRSSEGAVAGDCIVLGFLGATSCANSWRWERLMRMFRLGLWNCKTSCGGGREPRCIDGFGCLGVAWAANGCCLGAPGATVTKAAKQEPVFCFHLHLGFASWRVGCEGRFLELCGASFGCTKLGWRRRDAGPSSGGSCTLVSF